MKHEILDEDLKLRYGGFLGWFPSHHGFQYKVMVYFGMIWGTSTSETCLGDMQPGRSADMLRESVMILSLSGLYSACRHQTRKSGMFRWEIAWTTVTSRCCFTEPTSIIVKWKCTLQKHWEMWGKTRKTSQGITNHLMIFMWNHGPHGKNHGHLGSSEPARPGVPPPAEMAGAGTSWSTWDETCVGSPIGITTQDWFRS